MTSPRILHFVNTLSVRDGGAALAAAELNRNLNAHGVAQSRLISLRDHSSPQVTDGLEPGPTDGGDVARIDARPSDLRAFTSQIATEIHDADIVVIHGYYLWWAPMVAFVVRRQCKPLLVIPHGCLTMRQQRFSRRKKWLFDASAGRLVRDAAAAFVTSTPYEEDQFSAKFPSTFVATARLGVTSPPTPSTSELEGLHSPLRLLSVSRIAPKKRIDRMLGSLAKILEAGTDAHLTIAGEGDEALTSQLFLSARELGIQECVTFAGQVVGSSKQELYRSSDILLLPSEDENFGLAPIEALMQGCPVVVSSKVASTLPLAGDACAVIPDPSPSSMAAKVMEWVSTSSPPFQDRRRTAIHLSRREYSWESAMTDWRRVLSSF